MQPSVAFGLDGPDVAPDLRSALEAERQAERFTAGGGRGVVLRLGLLHGPGTGLDAPPPGQRKTLASLDAARALALALAAPAGRYEVVDGGGWAEALTPR